MRFGAPDGQRGLLHVLLLVRFLLCCIGRAYVCVLVCLLDNRSNVLFYIIKMFVIVSGVRVVIQRGSGGREGLEVCFLLSSWILLGCWRGEHMSANLLVLGQRNGRITELLLFLLDVRAFVV